jgi:hypothetical protein
VELLIAEGKWEEFLPVVTASQQPPLTQEQEVFLANILALFASGIEEKGRCTEPLPTLTAVDVLQAFEEFHDDPSLQYDCHKYLVRSGTLRNYFSSRGISINYVKEMGKNMYLKLAEMMRLKSVARRFQDAAYSFSELSDRLAALDLFQSQSFLERMHYDKAFEKQQNEQGIYLFRRV